MTTDPPKRVTTKGADAETADLSVDPETGQQRDYIVLSEEERKKGFVRPVRTKYVHDKCGTETIIGMSIAETYARDPTFYTGTFCPHCHNHFPLAEFTWSGTPIKLGT